MDRVPAEIWTRIFAFACTDTGYTGRQLSFVSRYVYETSKPARFLSVSLVGMRQILAFATVLQNTPPHLRRVQSLFISNCNPRTVTTDDIDSFITRARPGLSPVEYKQVMAGIRAARSRLMEERDYQAKVLSELFPALLRLIAPTLHTLTVFFTFPRTCTLVPIALPNLVELTLHGQFHPRINDGDTTFPSLQRLHFSPFHSYPPDLFKRLATLCPSLTHLRFSKPDHWHGPLLSHELTRILRTTALSPGDQDPELIQLPPTIEKILVQPSAEPRRAGECGTLNATYNVMLGTLTRLCRADKRFGIVNALPNDLGGTVYEAEKEWLERNNDGKGCWIF